MSVQPGQRVIFRPDGRVQHVECPEVLCPVCLHEVRPHDPIRRDGQQILHGNCWVKRMRSGERAGGAARPIAGSAGVSPWSVVADRMLHTWSTPDETIWLTRPARARAADARERVAATRRQVRVIAGIPG